MSRYKTARALEMAVKEAARKSPMDTNAAIEGFYFHRLLVRIFAGGESPFVLKGGHGMLARTLDARRTRDIDIATNELDIGAALQELSMLVSRDMDDFLSYEVTGCGQIKTGDRYRDGYSVDVSVSFGGRSIRSISIDLVSDEVECGRPEYLTPADRLEIDGLPVCDYPVYPVEAAMVDKLCGIMECHDGRPSSRVKDLVDLVVYVTHELVDSDELSACLRRERAVRGITLPASFRLPEGWTDSYGGLYGRLVSQTSARDAFPTMDDAANIASRMFDPVLDGTCEGMRWDPSSTSWKKKGAQVEILPSGPADREAIGEFIDAHGRRKGVEVRMYDYHVERDGRTVAGISAWAMGPDVHIDMLGVEEGQRRQGLGSVLLEHVEGLARRDGCTTASVDTFSFQAPDFCPRHGYEAILR